MASRKLYIDNTENNIKTRMNTDVRCNRNGRGAGEGEQHRELRRRDKILRYRMRPYVVIALKCWVVKTRRRWRGGVGGSMPCGPHVTDEVNTMNG